MMKPATTFMILGLGAVAIGSSILAWRQYKELVELRALAMNRDERTDLQARVQELEERNRALSDRLAVGRAHMAGEERAEASEAPPSRAAMGGPGRGGGPMRGLMENNPQAQALRSIQQQAALDGRYGALFRNLNLSPEQLSKFKALLVERQSAVMDVMAAAREQGIDPRAEQEQFRKLVGAAQASIDSSIKSTIGDAAFADYQAFEQTALERNTVRLLEQRLSYTNAPITPTQSEQLVQILASATPAGTAAPLEVGYGPGRGGGMGGAGPTVPITPATIAQAQTVLTPPQLTALQELQRQQQAQQDLHRIMDEATSTPATPGQGSGAPGAGSRPGGGD